MNIVISKSKAAVWWYFYVVVCHHQYIIYIVNVLGLDIKNHFLRSFYSDTCIILSGKYHLLSYTGYHYNIMMHIIDDVTTLHNYVMHDNCI